MLKIRASQVHKIMTGSLGLTEKQAETLQGYYDRDKPLTDRMKDDLAYLEDKRDNPELTKTTTDYLIELWTEMKYERSKDIKSKYLEKGSKQEEEAISLLYDVYEELYFKNEKDLSNKFFTGTPDIDHKHGKYVRDTKCSWDVFTFVKSKYESLNPAYEWQLQIYMDLLGYDEAYLDYCLVDTPENLIAYEQKGIEYDEQIKSLDDSVKARKEIEKALTFSDIPKEERVYTIKVKRDKSMIEDAKGRVKLCRKWWAENLPEINGFKPIN